MEIDFGTYHHSTPEESGRMRDRVESVFSGLLTSVYSADSEIRILDAGCGLGFLTSMAARCFPNSRITGVDIFGHGSLSDASLEKAGANMKALGIEPRVELRRHDLMKPLDSDGTYDMAISNLVFHNLGKKRYLAYETVFNALKDGGYFILGDLFPSLIEDVEFFNGRCSIVSEKVSEGSGKWAYRILLLQKKQNE